MQRVVSGEGIDGIGNITANTDIPRSNSENENSAVMMSHSPSVAFDDVANFVENDVGYNAEDDGGGNTDADDTIDTFNSRSSSGGARLDPEHQQEENELVAQRQNTVSPPIPINTATTQQQHQQTPLSIISGLLPATSLLPSISGASFGSGLQRSQNSSRDWGWFEDVHHSDQSVTGSVTASSRTTRHKNDGSSSSATTKRVSLPQHQMMNMRIGDSEHSGEIRNEEAGGLSSMMGSVGDGRNQDADTGGEDSTKKLSKKSTKKKTVSLLPTGNEMLVDESQEFLDEPIPIPVPKPVDIENGKSQALET